MSANLSPEEEKELVRRWQQGDTSVEAVLLEAYQPLINGLKYQYRWSGLEDDDLQWVAVAQMFNAFETYNPEKGGVESWARKLIGFKLFEVSSDWVGMSEAGRRIYNDVKAALNEFVQSSQRNRKTVRVGELLPLVAQRKPNWPRTTLRRATEEVLQYLSRTPPEEFVEDYGETPDKESRLTVPSARSHERSVETTVIHGERMQSFYNHVCDVLQSVERGRKWYLLWVLHVLIPAKKRGDVEWADICAWLQNTETEASFFWPDAHEYHSLPDDVPACWADAQQLYDVPPPTLNEANIKQWYVRKHRLVDPLTFFRRY